MSEKQQEQELLPKEGQQKPVPETPRELVQQRQAEDPLKRAASHDEWRTRWELRRRDPYAA